MGILELWVGEEEERLRGRHGMERQAGEQSFTPLFLLPLRSKRVTVWTELPHSEVNTRTHGQVDKHTPRRRAVLIPSALWNWKQAKVAPCRLGSHSRSEADLCRGGILRIHWHSLKAPLADATRTRIGFTEEKITQVWLGERGGKRPLCNNGSHFCFTSGTT